MRDLDIRNIVIASSVLVQNIASARWVFTVIALRRTATASTALILGKRSILRAGRKQEKRGRTLQLKRKGVF